MSICMHEDCGETGLKPRQPCYMHSAFESCLITACRAGNLLLSFPFFCKAVAHKVYCYSSLGLHIGDISLQISGWPVPADSKYSVYFLFLIVLEAGVEARKPHMWRAVTQSLKRRKHTKKQMVSFAKFVFWWWYLLSTFILLVTVWYFFSHFTSWS